eukprot:412362-Prymnesium_polylepis.1
MAQPHTRVDAQRARRTRMGAQAAGRYGRAASYRRAPPPPWGPMQSRGSPRLSAPSALCAAAARGAGWPRSRTHTRSAAAAPRACGQCTCRARAASVGEVVRCVVCRVCVMGVCSSDG